jgi:thioredoxin-dependent peroxiredoxin
VISFTSHNRKVFILREVNRVAEASFMLGDNELAVLGERVQVGQKAPEVELATGWVTTAKLLESTAGKTRLISVIPCLSTPVCDAQTRRMSEAALSVSVQVVVITISADPPPVQSIWCGAAGVDRVMMLSDHQEMAFGLAYGLYVPEMRAHQRALFIVDQHDVVRYAEYVPAIGQQPDYDAALAALRTLTGQ